MSISLNRKEVVRLSYGLKIEVWGQYALFSRPELKTERYSYEMMTPSAARGIIESIYWHPGVRVIIDRIYLLKGKYGITTAQDPFHYENVRRNEVKAKAQASQFESMLNGGADAYLSTGNEIQQRAATILRDVHYVIEFHFKLTEKAIDPDNDGKVCDILRRRIAKGQFFAAPYLGCREFPAFFTPWPEEQEIPALDCSRDLGIMLYDLDYSDPANILPMFFRAKLNHGVMQVSGEKVLR